MYRFGCPPLHRSAARLVARALLSAIVIGGGTVPIRSQAPTTAPAQYHVYALRFAELHGFPVHNFVLGADTARRQDVAFIIWALDPIEPTPAGAGRRVVLFDAGFYRDKFIRAWKPAGYSRPSEVIHKIGLAPYAITDIVISHVHWDHLDGVDLFPRAHIWIQKAEYEHYIDDHGRPLSSTIDTVDAAMLAKLHRAGRVTLVDGDDREIMPGITVYTGGRHTYASEYIGVHTPGGVVVLAADNAYTYENLDKHRPIAQLFDPGDSAANLHAQDRMHRIAADPRYILPGHEPEIFTRFPTPGDGVAKIQ
jgi:glyoxylase-like metal-dependent hydrolase (beta-lactamase superfamily II)